jgi:hypothetical protein
MKKKIFSRLVITVVWLSIVTLLRWQWRWDLIELWLGGLIGTFFLEIDHLLYVIAYPDEPTSFRVKELIGVNKWKEAVALLAGTVSERGRLTFHSAFFQIIFWVTCFFVLTSTGNLFGAGLVMAAALRLLVWEFGFIFGGREEELVVKLFWHFRGRPTLKQQKAFVYIMLVLFLVMNLFLI